MFPRRKDPPPPRPSAPGMTLEEAMQKTKASTSSSSKPSSSSTSKQKEKTAYEIDLVDKTAFTLPIVDRTVTSRKEKEKEKEKTVSSREREREREKEKQKEKERQRDKSAVNFILVDESSKKTPSRTRLREDTKYPFDYEEWYDAPGSSHAPSARQASHIPSIRTRTIVSSSRRPPPSTPSTLRHGDQSMAQRQTRYDSLTPAEKERQKTWVQDYLSRAAPCPADFPWRREDRHYRCYGSSHVITDELIAEGRGGFYLYTPTLYNDASCTTPFFGPYYPTTTSPEITYVYSGSQPKPRHAPDRIVDIIPEWDDQSAHFELTQIGMQNKLNWTVEDMVALNPALLREDGEVNYVVLKKLNEIQAEAQRKLKQRQRKQQGGGRRHNDRYPRHQPDSYNLNPGPGGYGASGFDGY